MLLTRFTLRNLSLVTFVSHLYITACLSPNSTRPSDASLPHSLSDSTSFSTLNSSGYIVSATAPSIYNTFPYIIPFNATQSCDIYGPLCQLGSMTVASEGTDNRITSAVIPCSSYLASQSSYLSNLFHLGAGTDSHIWYSGFGGGFGRSPECRSYKQMDLGQIISTSVWTFSECQGKDSTATHVIGSDFPPQIPFDRHEGDAFDCCGDCSVYASEVRLYYFREMNVTYDCQAMGRNALGSNITNGASKVANSLARRVVSLAPSGSIAIVSGNKLTSPSIYLEFLGTVGVSDACGTIGPKVNNPFVAVPPSDLFTYVEFRTEQGIVINLPLNGGMGHFATLDIIDVECPTWGVGTSVQTTGSYTGTFTTIGPPWLPIIAPPGNIMTLNPLWETLCTGIYKNYIGHLIFDPPHLLTPAQNMVPIPPEPSPVDPPPPDPKKSPPAQPGTTPKADQPLQTGVPGGPLAGDPPVTAAKPGTAAPVQPNIGGLIMQGFGPNPPPNSKSPAANDGAQEKPNAGQSRGEAIARPALTIGGQAFTPDPTGFAVGGTKISPSGPAATIAGTKISLAPSGILNIGDQFNILPTLTASTPPLMVGGVFLTSNPTGLPIASLIISPGNPSITISGTAISLDHSGILFIGDKATTLKPPLETAEPLLQASSQIFTANPQGFTIAGTSIAPGGPAAIISGTSISLNPSGTLTLGSLTLNLNPVPATATAISALSIGMQTFTPNPTRFTVDGKTVKSGASGVVIDGTSVSLEAGRVLHVSGEVLTLTTVEEAGISSTAAAGVGTGQTGASISGGNVTRLGSTQTFEGAAAGSLYCWQRVLWTLVIVMAVRFQVY